MLKKASHNFIRNKSMTINQNKKSSYYWVICFFSTIIIFMTTGVMLNSFSTYYPYFRELRGFDDSQIALIVTVRSAAGIISLAFANKYFEKLGLKKGIMAGVFLCGISLAMYANANSVVMLMVATFVGGVGSTLGSTFPVTLLINRWFIKNRGLALSICISGTGLSTVFVPNITVKVIENYGLDMALYLSAAVVSVLGLGSSLFLYNRPEDKGLLPYGEGESQEVKVKINNQTDRSIGTGMTVLLLVAMALQGIGSYEATQLFTLHYTNCGFTNAQAASALSVWGGVLTASKLVYGPLADKFGVTKTNAFSMIFATLGVGLCCFAYTQNYWVIMLASVFIGLSFPYNTIGTSLWASSLYKPEDYAKGFQRMNLVNQLGVMAFSVVPGFIAKYTGSYAIPYAMFAAMICVSIAIAQYLIIKHEKEGKVSVSSFQDAGGTAE